MTNPNALTEAQLVTMLTLQEALNSKVTKNWRDENHDWCVAIVGEAWEAYDHSGWKWWKDSGKGPDTAQMKMEVIDIWHFLLSEMMMYNIKEGTSYFELITDVTSGVDSILPDLGDATISDVRECLMRLINSASSHGEHVSISGLLQHFYVVMVSMNISWDELYKLYLAKNILNEFRQAKGYKQGTYFKTWGGREDNEILTEIMNTLDVKSSTFQTDIMTGLENKYLEVMVQNSVNKFK
jgi:dimeric dUTPase (all-alpha-NTP-PPase superfamily)